jgi:hypothetical protein
MAMPLVLLLGTVVLIAGMVGVEVTAAHAGARAAARAAAAGEDVHARLAAMDLDRLEVVRVEPPPQAAEAGEPVTVELVAASRALDLVGAEVQLRASATAAREPSPPTPAARRQASGSSSR